MPVASLAFNLENVSLMLNLLSPFAPNDLGPLRSPSTYLFLIIIFFAGSSVRHSICWEACGSHLFQVSLKISMALRQAYTLVPYTWLRPQSFKSWS